MCELQKEECISGKTIGVMAGPCKSKMKVPVIQFSQVMKSLFATTTVLFCYLFRNIFSLTANCC